MSSATNEKATAPTVASSEKTLLTVADFKSWLVVTQAAREEADAETRRQAEDDVVRFVSRKMGEGLSINQAAEWFIDISKELRTSSVHREAACAALEEMGYVPPRRKGSKWPF